MLGSRRVSEILRRFNTAQQSENVALIRTLKKAVRKESQSCLANHTSNKQTILSNQNKKPKATLKLENRGKRWRAVMPDLVLNENKNVPKNRDVFLFSRKSSHLSGQKPTITTWIPTRKTGNRVRYSHSKILLRERQSIVFMCCVNWIFFT